MHVSSYSPRVLWKITFVNFPRDCQGPLTVLQIWCLLKITSFMSVHSSSCSRVFWKSAALKNLENTIKNMSVKNVFFFRFLTCNSTIKREILLYEKKYVTVFLGLIFPNNFQWFKKVVGKIEGLTSCWSYIWNLLFLYYYLKLKTHCCANFCATKYIFGYFDWGIKDSSKWKHIINRLKGRTHSTAPVHVYLLGRG